MPTVAIVEGVSIVFYMNEHPPAHFHAKYAEHRAIISIDELDVLEGHLPKAKERVVRTWAESRRDALLGAWMRCQSRLSPEPIK